MGSSEIQQEHGHFVCMLWAKYTCKHRLHRSTTETDWIELTLWGASCTILWPIFLNEEARCHRSHPELISHCWKWQLLIQTCAVGLLTLKHNALFLNPFHWFWIFMNKTWHSGFRVFLIHVISHHFPYSLILLSQHLNCSTSYV